MNKEEKEAKFDSLEGNVESSVDIQLQGCPSSLITFTAFPLNFWNRMYHYCNIIVIFNSCRNKG